MKLPKKAKVQGGRYGTPPFLLGTSAPIIFLLLLAILANQIKDGNVRRPPTKKKKVTDMAQAIVTLAENNKQASQNLRGAIEGVANTMATKATKATGANAEINDRVKKVEEELGGVKTHLCEILDILKKRT